VIVVALDDLIASKEWADILIAAASRTDCPERLRVAITKPRLEHPPDGGHRRHGGVAAGQLGVDGQRSGVDAEVGQLPVGVAAMLPSFVGFSVFVPRTSTTG
jgi:hypothetical protein